MEYKNNDNSESENVIKPIKKIMEEFVLLHE